MKQEKAITLIALVITIVILIILAGITISLLVKDGGLIEKIEIAKEESTIKGIAEKLELVKGSDYINELGENSIDTYLGTLEKDKIEPYIITNQEKLSDITAVVEVDEKYSFLVTVENNQNVKVDYEGKIEEIDRTQPIINITVAGDITQNKLPINLTATVTSNDENVKELKWILNTSSEKLGTEESIYTQNANEIFDFTIETANTYYLHTLTKDRYGRKIEGVSKEITV